MTTWYQISCPPWTKPRWSWLGAYPAEENASEHTTLLVWPARVVGQRYIPPEGPWLVGLADRGFSVVFGFRFDSFDSISFKMSLQTALRMQSLFANPTCLHQPRPHPRQGTPIERVVLFQRLPYTYHTEGYQWQSAETS